MSYLLLLTILCSAAFFDYKYMKVPNLLFPIAFLTSIILLSTGYIDKTFLSYVLDFCLVFIPLVFIWAIGTIFSIKMIGAGDVKLYSILPFFLPLKEVGIILLGSILLAVLLNLFRSNLQNFNQSKKDMELFIFYGIPSVDEPSYRTKVALAPYIFVFSVCYFIYLIFM